MSGKFSNGAELPRWIKIGYQEAKDEGEIE
jgi:hypothetical protein